MFQLEFSQVERPAGARNTVLAEPVPASHRLSWEGCFLHGQHRQRTWAGVPL